MKKPEWEECLDGYEIVECAIKNNRVAYALAVELRKNNKANEDWRIISWSPDVFPDNQTIGKYTFNNLSAFPALTVEGNSYERVFLADTGGYGFLASYGKEDIPLMSKLKTLWGDLYIMSFAAVFKRNSEENKWEKLSLPSFLLEENTQNGIRDYTLVDFDAFSPDEFYLLCWNGRVFYQVDGEWKGVGLKTLGFDQLQTDAICCGPDGWVYIFARDEKGTKVLQGKGEQWQVIWTSDSDIYYIDFVAYQDYVLLSNSDMLVKIKNGQVEPFEAPIQSKFLSVRDNLLMIANSSEAVIFDGKEWKFIISPHFDEAGQYQVNGISTDEEASTYSRLELYGITFDHDGIIEKYPELHDRLHAYEYSNFKVHEGDLVIEGDLDLDNQGYGLIVEGDLTVKGEINNKDSSFGAFLYVKGKTKAETAIFGSSLILLNELEIERICYGITGNAILEAKSLLCPWAVFEDEIAYVGDKTGVEFYYEEIGDPDEDDPEDLKVRFANMVPAFENEEWFHVDDINEFDEFIWCELDQEKFYEKVVSSSEGFEKAIKKLRDTRERGGLIPPPVLERKSIPALNNYWVCSYDELKKAFHKKGFELRDELLILGGLHQESKITTEQLLDSINQTFDKYNEQSVNFGCSQIFQHYSDQTDDIAIRPYVFSKLVMDRQPNSSQTLYFMLQLTCSQQIQIIREVLGKEGVRFFDQNFLATVLKYAQYFGVEYANVNAASNAYRLFELNVGRSSALDVVDKILQTPEWDSDIYSFLWGLCYQGNRDVVYPISQFPHTSEYEIERGLELASKILLQFAKEGKEISSYGRAAFEHLTEFKHTHAIEWKKQKIKDEVWLDQFDIEFEGKNFKERLVRFLKRSLVN